MAMKNTQRGFALLIAVIFMSVMLAFGLALASLSYKQQVLASSAVESQYAFYAADAGLECALYADQQENLFAYPTPQPINANAYLITCDGGNNVTYPPSYPTGIVSYTPTQWVVTERISLDSNTRCVDVTVYKPNGAGSNYIFAQGYNLSCANVANPQAGGRVVSRGINIRY